MRIAVFVCVLYALGATGAFVGSRAVHAETISVVRGTEVEIIDPAKMRPDEVNIARPSITPAPEAADEPAAPRSTQIDFVAGNTFWTRDARTGGLVACYVGSSGIVGKDVIRCTDRGIYGR